MSRAASPAGTTPAASSASQSAGGGAGRDQHLDPVLAGVAGPADERHSRRVLGFACGRAGSKRQFGGVKARRQLAFDDPGDDLARPRALDGEHRVVGEPVGDLDLEAVGVLAQPGEVALVVGGVGHGQVAVGRRAGR